MDIIKSSKTIIPKKINTFALKYIFPAREQVNTALINHFKEKQELFLRQNIHFINLLEVQKEYQLVSTKTSKLLYFDGGHLNEDGATELGKKLKVKHPYLFI